MSFAQWTTTPVGIAVLVAAVAALFAILWRFMPPREPEPGTIDIWGEETPRKPDSRG